MNDPACIVLYVIALGCGATVTIDLWAIIRARLLGVPALNYGMVGRWLGHLARGTFRHTAIAAAAPVRNERIIGWIAHYLIGVAFAGVLFAISGAGWIRHPTPGPALAVGIVSSVAPFLVLQPGMGLGIAASRTPRPRMARLHTLITHGLFGVGLYVTGLLVSGLNACVQLGS